MFGFLRKRAEKKGLLFKRYVKYIIDDEPKRTAVTLIEDSVPGTNSKLYQADVTWLIDSVIHAVEQSGSAYASSHIPDIKNMLKKAKNQIEPDYDEWNRLDYLLDNMDFG